MKHEWHRKTIRNGKRKTYMFVCAKCGLKKRTIRKDNKDGKYVFPEHWPMQIRNPLNCYSKNDLLCIDIII